MRHIGKMNPSEAIEWFTKAAQESPGRREPFMDMAKHYYNAQDWENCYKSSMEALRITEKKLDYMCEEDSWSELPYDYAALSAYHLGRPEEALVLNKKAIKINPNDERLKKNSEWYRLAISEKA
jgi:tetratricopeptide (TPR) repeat protein